MLKLASRPRSGWSAAFAPGPLLFFVIAAGHWDQALAQSKLETGYRITFARIPVGQIVATLELGASEYTVSAAGNSGGAIRWLMSGEAAFATRGTVKDGRAVPVSFTTADSK
jgi:hypothetical protein